MIEFFDINLISFDYLRPLNLCLDNEHLKRVDVVEYDEKTQEFPKRFSYWSKELFLTEIEEKFIDYINILEKTELKYKKPLFWKIGDYLRIIYLSNFNKQNFILTLEENWKFINNWEKNNFIEVENIITKGGIYQLGRDKELRPTIIIDLGNFKPSYEEEINFNLALSFIFKFTKTVMLLPDYLEKWNIIINISNLGIFGFKVGILQNIINFMNKFYNGHLNKIFIINGGTMVKIAWNGITNFLNQDQIKKVEMLDNLNELENYYDKNQLEERFGGFIILDNYWPPLDRYENEINKLYLKELLINNIDIFYFDEYDYNAINDKRPKQTIVKSNFNQIKSKEECLMDSYKINNINNNRQTYKYKNQIKKSIEYSNNHKTLFSSEIKSNINYDKQNSKNKINLNSNNEISKEILEEKIEDSKNGFENPFFEESNNIIKTVISKKQSLNESNNLKISKKNKIFSKNKIIANNKNYKIVKIINEDNIPKHSFIEKDKFLKYLEDKYGKDENSINFGNILNCWNN